MSTRNNSNIGVYLYQKNIIMKKLTLLFVLSFYSLLAGAAVGDLYYCEMIQAVELKEERLIKYIPQKYKFRIVEDNLIQFGKDANYFNGLELEITEFSNNYEQFYGDNFEYSHGSFYFADVIRWPSDGHDTLTATAVSAQCSIVDDYSV